MKKLTVESLTKDSRNTRKVLAGMILESHKQLEESGKALTDSIRALEKANNSASADLEDAKAQQQRVSGMAAELEAAKIDLQEAERLLKPFKGMINEPFRVYEDACKERDELRQTAKDRKARIDELLGHKAKNKPKASFMQRLKAWF